MPDRNDYTHSAWRAVVLAVLSCAIFFAPLVYGGTTPVTAAWIGGMLYVVFLFWTILLLLERRRPRIRAGACITALIALTAIGACHALNPKFYFQSDPWALIPIPGGVEWLPGTVDAEATRSVVFLSVGLLVAFVALIDLMSLTSFRWGILKSIALSGFVISLIGLTQKAGHVDSMLWAGPENSGKVFFAAFRYHANAASFLNLCWPASLALWLRSRQEGAVGMAKSLWLAVLFFTLLAVFVNSSKAGQILGLVGLTYAAIRYRKLLFSRETSRAVLAVSLVLGIGVFGISILPSVASTIDNWGKLVADGGSLHARLLAYWAALHVIPDSGLFGTGPGTFRMVFPFYTGSLGDQISGVWYHAHQDYLQTMIEWGLVGAAAWGVVVLGGFWRAIVRVRDAVKKNANEYSASCSILAILLVLLHALVDFPFQIPAIQLLVMVYLAVFWSVKGEGRYRKSGARKRDRAPAGERFSDGATGY